MEDEHASTWVLLLNNMVTRTSQMRFLVVSGWMISSTYPRTAAGKGLPNLSMYSCSCCPDPFPRNMMDTAPLLPITATCTNNITGIVFLGIQYLYFRARLLKNKYGCCLFNGFKIHPKKCSNCDCTVPTFPVTEK
jgi:hypothetical protein